jgi:hypothetical protein
MAEFKPLHERYDVKPDGCWEWTSFKDGNGYGRFYVGRRYFSAHRYFYEWMNSVRIPPGMTLDHLCKNKACVNPKHLEVVTPGVNTRRAHMKEECLRGHPFSGDNLLISANGQRYCRACQRIRESRRGSRPRYLR